MIGNDQFRAWGVNLIARVVSELSSNEDGESRSSSTLQSQRPADVVS
jgi:hypothetical protein